VGRALEYSYDVAISPDGGSVYVAGASKSNGGFAVFSRQATPVCANATVNVQQATPTPVSLSCLDPNGNPFTRQIVTGPAHGKLGAVSSAGTVVYTPSKSFFGTDRIAFRASDVTGHGVTSQITLIVVRDRTPPKCNQFRKPAGSVTTFLSHGLAVHMTCSEATTLKLKMTVSRRVARGLRLAGNPPVKIASGKGFSTGAGKVFVTLKFTAGARRALASANPRALGVTVGVVAVDRAGNRATKRVPLTLK
jgi:DNA-binding beta-propeller fold protein YncE